MLVEYKSDLITKFIPTPGVSRRWMLTEPFDFRVDGIDYQVPRGFYTDGASVPRFAHPIVNPFELGVGFVPHDFGYFTSALTRSYWDDVFDEFMRLDCIAWLKRVAAYNVVRTFGWATWNNYRRKNKTHTLHLAASGSYEIEGWEREAVA